MSASGSSNFYSKSKRQKNRQIKGRSEFHEFFPNSFILRFFAKLLSKTCLQKIEKNQILEILNEMLIDMSWGA